MDKYAIIGRSLGHSLSPEMHNLAFNILNMDASYQKVEIKPDRFENDLASLREQDYSGFNITIPYKNKILPYLDKIDDEAQKIGAVNTIKVLDDQWIGFNTDIAGFIEPVLSLNRSFNKCIVLGNGGAARAVVYAIQTYLKPKEIYICARNEYKSQDIINQYPESNIVHRSIKSVIEFLIDADLVINTTPLGTSPDTKASVIEKMDSLQENAIVYDLVYNPPITKLIGDAKQLGKNITTIGGLEMLVEQAAKSFQIWNGKKFPSAQVRERLEQILQADGAM